MTARTIDGKAIAAELRGKVADAVHRLARDRGIVPGLAVVLVGNNPASESYVGSKMKMTVGSGMRSFDHRLPTTTGEAELLTLIGRLNADPTVHGILVQLPLPKQIDPQKIIAAIDPMKDVDGFHPVNAGRLSAGLPSLAPCTPVGCVLLAKTIMPSLAGLEAVVIGRSNIVGKPLAQLLLAENATVTIAHSRTRDLPKVCARADVLFAAVNVARKAGIHPTIALREATEKFVRRFKEVEKMAESKGIELGKADLSELDVLWDAVKETES